jgi:hypothetical protein
VGGDEITPQQIRIEAFVEDCLKSSWATFKQDAVLLILAHLVVALVGGLTLGILAGPLCVGLIDVVRRVRRGEAATVGDVFQGLSKFGTAFGASIVILLGILIGLALCVLPGIAVAFVTSLTFTAIAYDDRDAIGALRESYALTTRHLWPVVAVNVVNFAINAVGGAIPFGVLLTAPFGFVMVCVLYERLRELPSSGD